MHQEPFIPYKRMYRDCDVSMRFGGLSGYSQMNRSLLAVALLALGGVSSVSYAAENPSGVYLGAGVGQFNVQIDDIDQTDNAIERLDDDDAAWKAFVGYRINPYIALEAAYIDFGKPNTRSETSGSSGDYRVELNGFAPYVI